VFSPLVHQSTVFGAAVVPIDAACVHQVYVYLWFACAANAFTIWYSCQRGRCPAAGCGFALGMLEDVCRPNAGHHHMNARLRVGPLPRLLAFLSHCQRCDHLWGVPCLAPVPVPAQQHPVLVQCCANWGANRRLGLFVAASQLADIKYGGGKF
jgi:hypothetical protein